MTPREIAAHIELKQKRDGRRQATDLYHLSIAVAAGFGGNSKLLTDRMRELTEAE